ncbi:hypothetical protein CHARACLAT_015132 [Characodon lateralis]|uniref:Uncharacterized protein n=1 Tax=Characodon lateralis TaxID=208331 RepID=A0ABU7EA88_9TELE|nr:hypothetical protein [Characodon lateralis]
MNYGINCLCTSELPQTHFIPWLLKLTKFVNILCHLPSASATPYCLLINTPTSNVILYISLSIYTLWFSLFSAGSSCFHARYTSRYPVSCHLLLFQPVFLSVFLVPISFFCSSCIFSFFFFK